MNPSYTSFTWVFGVRYVPYLLNEYVGVLRDASHSQNLGNVVDDNEITA